MQKEPEIIFKIFHVVLLKKSVIMYSFGYAHRQAKFIHIHYEFLIPAVVKTPVYGILNYGTQCVQYGLVFWLCINEMYVCNNYRYNCK